MRAQPALFYWTHVALILISTYQVSQQRSCGWQLLDTRIRDIKSSASRPSPVLLYPQVIIAVWIFMFDPMLIAQLSSCLMCVDSLKGPPPPSLQSFCSFQSARLWLCGWRWKLSVKIWRALFPSSGWHDHTTTYSFTVSSRLFASCLPIIHIDWVLKFEIKKLMSTGNPSLCGWWSWCNLNGWNYHTDIFSAKSLQSMADISVYSQVTLDNHQLLVNCPHLVRNSVSR